MGFQGFAREEQFSTNKINIDINSVINNDLAEAGRQSKIMADNAQLESKWGQMYLNAMINKHEVEKDNRDRNFKFFMDNRANIQKQVEYNQKIEHENAGKIGPAPISETIIPILWDFATKAGSIVIQKAVAKNKAAKEKANREADKNAFASIADMTANASAEQQKLVAAGHFSNENHWNASAEQQQKNYAYYDSLGDHKSTESFARGIHRANGLEAIDWQRNQYNDINVSAAYTETIRTFETEINGRTFNYVQAAESGNPATLNEFLERARAHQSKLLDGQSRGGRGRLPEIRRSNARVFTQIEGSLRRRNDAVAYNDDLQSNYSQVASGLSHAIQEGGGPGAVDYIGGTKGPFFIQGHQRGREVLTKLFKSGAYDSSIMKYILQNGKFFGPNGEKWNPKTPYGAELLKIVKAQEVSEQQDYQHGIDRQEFSLMQQTDAIRNGALSQQQARVTITSATTPGSELHNTLAHISEQGGGTVVKDYMTALQQQSGVIPVQEYANPNYKIATEIYTETEFKAFTQTASQYGLSAAQLPETLPEDQNPAIEWGKHFVSNIIGDLAKQGITDEASIRAAVIAATDPDNKAYKEFVRMVTPQVYETEAFARGEKIPLKKPKYYPRLQTALKEAVPYSNGRNEYETLRQNAINAGTTVNRADIWQEDVLRGKMGIVLDTLEAARERGPEALQDALSRLYGTFVGDIAKSWKYGSIGQVVNSAINEGNYEKKYTQLKGNEFQDPRQVEALVQEQGRALMRQPEAVQQIVRQQTQQGVIPFAPHVRQPVQAIIGSDVTSQGIGAWRDGKHEDHNHYAFESTAHRDQASTWVKSEYKRRWGNEYLLDRDELEINHHEDRQGSSHHGAQGGHRASDVPRHNFVHGEGETIGANRVHQLYAEWFGGGN